MPSSSSSRPSHPTGLPFTSCPCLWSSRPSSGPSLAHSCPKPTVSSTAIISFCCRSWKLSYAGRSSRLKLTARVSTRPSVCTSATDIPCVRLGQSPLLPGILDGESPRSIAALQILEPVDRYSRRPRRKLQQTRFLFRVPTLHALPPPS